MLIENILTEIGKNTGFINILNPQFIEKCHYTAFTWTERRNSICLAMGKDYLKAAINNPNIQGIVTSPQIIAGENTSIPKCIILLEQPDQFFYYLHNAKLHEQFSPVPFVPFIAPSAQISPGAKIAENVQIGANTIIHEGAIILDNSIIGDNVVIYQNVTIGTTGFFSKSVLGKKIQIEHFGGVKIGNNCIIHAGSNISRAVNYHEHTTLGNNTHMGIHANIAHDCQIGEACDISAKVCLAGRVKVGNNVWIGAAATVSNGIQIESDAAIKIGAVVIADVQQKKVVSGNFAINHQKHLREFISKKDDPTT